MEDLRLAVEDMHSSSQCGSALIQQIVAGGDSLARELAATRIGFKAGFLFAKAIDRVQEAIGKVQEKVESSRPPDDRDEPKTMFADLAGQYTMQAERDVHDAIDRANKGSVQKAAPAEAGATSAEDGSELEGNVEFF